MRKNSRLIFILLIALAPLSGCQTDRQGMGVDAGALLRAYRARLDPKPDRVDAERIVALLKAEQLNDLGVLYEREGRLEAAVWAYQHAVWRNPRFGLAYVNLGNVLRKQGKRAEARFRYRQAMAADPYNFEAVNNFADLCAEDKTNLEEAIARLEPVVQSSGPYRAYGLDTLGWLYHLQGDNAKARALLEASKLVARPEDKELRQLIEQHLIGIDKSDHFH